MTEHLHYVSIAGTTDKPRIEFTCRGGQDAECHRYPDCDCEVYLLGEEVDEAGHPFVKHDECWMKSWFDNGSTAPCADDPITLLDDCGYRPGMSGPINVESYVPDYVEWEFIEGAAR